MTLNELQQAFTGRAVDFETVEEKFLHMGKFGKMTLYGFSFETESSAVQVEVCVQQGKIVGFTPEKEPRTDDWGFTAPEEEYTEDLTNEECRRIEKYLTSILA